MMDMPPWLNHVAVMVEQANRELGPNLIDSLKSYHRIVDVDPEHAEYWLIIENDSLQEHINSVGSNATSRQYELTYSVQFKLTKAHGPELVPSSRISITRQATINNNRILGSNQEEELLVHEMRRAAVIQIINRINRYHAD